MSQSGARLCFGRPALVCVTFGALTVFGLSVLRTPAGDSVEAPKPNQSAVSLSLGVGSQSVPEKQPRVLLLTSHTQLSLQLRLHDLQLRSFHAYLDNIGDVHIVAVVDEVGFCRSLDPIAEYRFNSFLHCVPRAKESPSVSHARSLNWAMRNVVDGSRLAPGGVFVVHGDVLPISRCDLFTLAYGERWSCLPQRAPAGMFCSPCALGLSADILPAEPLDFRPTSGADAGALTEHLILQRRPQYLRQEPCEPADDAKLNDVIASLHPPCVLAGGPHLFMHLQALASSWYYNESFIASSLRLLSGWHGWPGPPPDG